MVVIVVGAAMAVVPGVVGSAVRGGRVGAHPPRTASGQRDRATNASTSARWPGPHVSRVMSVAIRPITPTAM